MHLTVLDGTDGSRDLREGDPGVATARVVGLRETVWDLAAFAGIRPMDYGGIHGIRDAILMPEEDHYTVVLLVLPEDNPALFGRRETEPIGTAIGRLAQADSEKWAESFAGRMIRVVVYLEAKPGTRGTAQARFRPELLVDEEAPPPATPPAGWFPDPYGAPGLRWWDGTQWTQHTHPGQ